MEKQYRITQRELIETEYPISSIAEIHLFLGRWDIPNDAVIVDLDLTNGDFILQLP